MPHVARSFRRWTVWQRLLTVARQGGQLWHEWRAGQRLRACLVRVRVGIVLTGCLLALSERAWAAPPEAMIRVRLATGTVEGQPLWWSDDEVKLLARDGQLVSFRMGAAQEYSQSASRFVPYSYSEMRARLQTEFGRDFDVSGTGHYLVVHPRGEREAWAERFEQLYRAFYHYFQTRGLRMQEPQCQLVAVVFPSQRDYIHYAHSVGDPVDASVLGHYSLTTNRIYLYDYAAEHGLKDWSQNAETVIHEATHQVAFNTGVHSRLHATPRWLVEGLAMMFEAPGVWRASANSTQRDRLHRSRLAEFRVYAATRRGKTALIEMLARDRLFASDPSGAYAQAWAFSFYLSETRPREYAQYLVRTAARPDFQDYTPAERLADFTAEFGSDLEQLDAQFLRYIDRLE